MLTLVLDDTRWSPGRTPARLVNEWRDEGRVFAVAGAAGPDRWIEWEGLGVFRFNDDSPEVRLHGHGRVDARFAADVFACVVQPLILQARGFPVLHASAAVGPDGAVVFCGLSGSGKSTMAYALGQLPGFKQVADDAVVIRSSDGETFDVVPLPFRSRLRQSAADFFSTPSVRVSGPSPSTAPVPLHAIVVVSQADALDSGHHEILPVPPTDAFSILLTHAHCFDQSDRAATRQMVQAYLAMADRVGVFRLTYRPAFSALPDLLSAIVAATAR